jgi:NAD(P)-dependent dehydrogenase (short-subunit alcohol dehydrogenase family)
VADQQISAGTARAAVVTGAARGIGREIATQLVERGYVVFVTDRDGADASATAREIGAHAGLALDVTDPKANREVAAAASDVAPLAVWVCNAGVLFEGNAFDLTEQQARATVDVNVLGVLWGVQAATAVFREQASVGVRGGDIAIMASLSAHAPVSGLSVYAASKAAVLSLTTSLVAELRADHIRVHALCPDGVDTQMVRSMASDGHARQILAAGVLYTPADVARELVDMIGTRRVIKTMPRWRGVLGRIATLAPGFAARVDGPMKRMGARRLRRGKAVPR